MIDPTLPSGRWEEQIFQTANCSGGRQEGKQDFAGRVSIRKYTNNVPTIMPERYFSSVALSFLPAPQFANVVDMSLTMYFIWKVSLSLQRAAGTQESQIPQSSTF